jgi:hypothetical protein
MKEPRPWPFPSTAYSITRTTEAQAKGNHLAAQNDEPEPKTFARIEDEENEAARAIVAGRQVLRAKDLNQAEQEN